MIFSVKKVILCDLLAKCRNSSVDQKTSFLQLFFCKNMQKDMGIWQGTANDLANLFQIHRAKVTV